MTIAANIARLPCTCNYPDCRKAHAVGTCSDCKGTVYTDDTLEVRGKLYHENCYEDRAGDWDARTDWGIPKEGR